MYVLMFGDSSLILKKITRSGKQSVCLGSESLRTASHGSDFTPMPRLIAQMPTHRFSKAWLGPSGALSGWAVQCSQSCWQRQKPTALYLPLLNIWLIYSLHCFRNVQCFLPTWTNNSEVFLCNVEWIKENFSMRSSTYSLVLLLNDCLSLVKQGWELEEKRSGLDRPPHLGGPIKWVAWWWPMTSMII